MTARSASARRIANGIVTATALLLAANALFKAIGRPLNAEDRWDVLYLALTALGAALYLAIGRAIVVRQPRNAVGWLLLVVPLVVAFALANGSYATHTNVIEPGSLPFGRASVWVDRWIAVPVAGCFIAIFLLFPDGRLPSRRWRPVGLVALAAPIVATLGMAVTPGRVTGSLADLQRVRVTNPLGVPIDRAAVEVVTQLAGLAMLGVAVAAFIGIVVRFRRADPDTRQQIRWLGVVGAAFFVALVFGTSLAALGLAETAVAEVDFVLLFVILMIGTPVACWIAILRYRLYDLDLVIRKTVVFAALVALIAAVYVLIVAGVGALLGASADTALTFVAVGILALVIQPARQRAQRFANRVVYGKRATPYEVLSEFSERMSDAYATDEVLPRMAAIVGDGIGAAAASVGLLLNGELREVARWESGVRGATQEHTFEVRHRGELLGAIGVQMRQSDPMDVAKERLVADLAAGAGLVLRNVRLIEELRGSRERLVAAQDQERRRIERNIHDGAQQQLVALALKLRLVDSLIGRDDEKAHGVVSQLQTDAQETLDDLRDLARGIYPPLLADHGLVAAIEAQARKSPLPVALELTDVGRVSQEIEAAAYFCVLEALQNAGKYAAASSVTVRLARDDGVLGFSVSDDGVGFDPAITPPGSGLRNIRDRLEALGGSVDFTSRPGAGTRVEGRVPVGDADP